MMKKEYIMRCAKRTSEANEIIDELIKEGYEPISVGASESFLSANGIYILFKLKPDD